VSPDPAGRSPPIIASVRDFVERRVLAEASTVEFVARMRALGVEIPEADYSSLATPDGCVDYLFSKLQR
jgi:hypothetical protein